MRLLALADTHTLQSFWNNLSPQPQYTMLRQPEVGLVMIKAQSCGNGQHFHFGEMPISRCAIHLNDKVGHGCVQGRNKDHALYMALFDALLQEDHRRAELKDSLLALLELALNNTRTQRQKELLKTKVTFFTMVRGEDS